MRPAVFRAASLHDAMARVIDALGADALVLSTRKVQRDPDGSEFYEVLAAPGPGGPPASRRPRRDAPGRQSPFDDALDELQQEVARLREVRRRLSAAVRDAVAEEDAKPDELLPGVPPAIARALVARAAARTRPVEGMRQAAAPDLCAEVRQALRTTTAPWAGASPAPIALVGPSGSGKTTLAWHVASAARRRGIRAAVVVGDAGRAGRVELAHAMGRTLRIAARTAHTPEEVLTALASLTDVDVVVIDTPPVDAGDERAWWFVELLVARGGVSVCGTVHACWSHGEIARVVRWYEAHGVLDVALTGADLAPTPGAALVAVWETRCRLAAVAHGSIGRGGVQPADADALARAITGEGRAHHSRDSWPAEPTREGGDPAHTVPAATAPRTRGGVQP